MLREGDSVALALEDFDAGDLAKIGSLAVKVRQRIEFGHKIAVRDIRKGEGILKHGEVIGRATKDIKAGEHVHVHNIESMRAKSK